MKKLLIVYALVLSATALHAQDLAKLQDFQKGSWLFHVCQVNIRNFDAPNGGNPAETGPIQECLDYIQGFVEGAEVSTARFCVVADETSTNTMIRVYLNYMQAHPKLLDEHRVMGLLLALKESYPCPRSQ